MSQTRLTGYPSLTGIVNGDEVTDAITTIDRDPTAGTTTVTLTDAGQSLVLAVDGQTLTVTPDGTPGALVRLPVPVVQRANRLLRDAGMTLPTDFRTGTHTLRVGPGRRDNLVGGQPIRVPFAGSGTGRVASPTSTPDGSTVEATMAPPPANALSGLTDTGAFSGEVIVPPAVQRQWDKANAKHAKGLPSNLMLAGPPGVGKTHIAKALSDREGRRVFEFGCMGMEEPGQWFGPVGFADGRTTFSPTPFYWALVTPGPRTLILDEVTRASTVAANALLGVLAGNPTITLPHNGQTLAIMPDLKIVLTANIGNRYAGASALDTALVDRLSNTAQVPYLDPADEERLLVDRMAHHGVTLEPWQAAVLVRFANEVRVAASRNEDIPPVSPRQLLDAASDIAAGGDSPLQAVEDGILSTLDRDGDVASPYTAYATIVAGLDWTDPASRTPTASVTGPHEWTSADGATTVGCTVTAPHTHNPATGVVEGPVA